MKKAQSRGRILQWPSLLPVDVGFELSFVAFSSDD